LHAIFPAPESGDEWIELIVPTGTTLAQAENWSLHDASASIYRFAGANERVSINGNIWRISLASARLNNSGDSVELTRPDGSVAERMSFPETTRGTGWRKNVNNTAWIQDPPPIVQVAPTPSPVTTSAPAPIPAIHPTSSNNRATDCRCYHNTNSSYHRRKENNYSKTKSNNQDTSYRETKNNNR
jgi:hypothetical protein